MPKKEVLSLKNIKAAFEEAGYEPAKLEITPANGHGVKIQFEINGVVACGHMASLPDCAAARKRYISNFVRDHANLHGHKITHT